jgi:hypothetical protein
MTRRKKKLCGMWFACDGTNSVHCMDPLWEDPDARAEQLLASAIEWELEKDPPGLGKILRFEWRENRLICHTNYDHVPIRIIDVVPHERPDVWTPPSKDRKR